MTQGLNFKSNIFHLASNNSSISPLRHIDRSCALFRAAARFRQSFSTFSNQHSAVERLFSQGATAHPQGGLIMRPHRARLSDKIVSQLICLQCNSSD